MTIPLYIYIMIIKTITIILIPPSHATPAAATGAAAMHPSGEEQPRAVAARTPAQITVYGFEGFTVRASICVCPGVSVCLLVSLCHSSSFST